MKVVDGIARRGQLRAARLAPVFLELQRNLEWWGGGQPLLANGQRITFEGSELVYQEVPGQGLHLHPLANFGKLNAYAKASKRTNARAGQLLDELMAIAVPRGGGLAWEYYFTFDGGKGPWVSGLAQGTGLQAIARTAQKLGRLEELRPAIEQGLTLFEQAPPTGVRIGTPAGAHYAQYSFWPSLRILNGFIQSLVGLFDVAQITGSARARQLYRRGRGRGQGRDPDLRHRRVVVLLARSDQARVGPLLPRAAARLPRQPVRPHGGDRVLHGRDALHDLPRHAAGDQPAHGRPARRQGRHARLLAVEDLDRDDHDHRARRPPGAAPADRPDRARNARGHVGGAPQARGSTSSAWTRPTSPAIRPTPRATSRF